MKQPTVRTATLLAVCLALAPWAAAPTHASCGRGPFEVVGRVGDASGRPLEGARVRILLDRVSRKKFEAQGVRVQGVTTDRSGRFRLDVVCGGRPDPCASRPKHLTLVAQHSGHAMKLRVHRLKDLDVTELDRGCRVAAPELRLSAGIDP